MFPSPEPKRSHSSKILLAVKSGETFNLSSTGETLLLSLEDFVCSDDPSLASFLIELILLILTSHIFISLAAPSSSFLISLAAATAAALASRGDPALPRPGEDATERPGEPLRPSNLSGDKLDFVVVVCCDLPGAVP